VVAKRGPYSGQGFREEGGREGGEQCMSNKHTPMPEAQVELVLAKAKQNVSGGPSKERVQPKVGIPAS